MLGSWFRTCELLLQKVIKLLHRLPFITFNQISINKYNQSFLFFFLNFIFILLNPNFHITPTKSIKRWTNATHFWYKSSSERSNVWLIDFAKSFAKKAFKSENHNKFSTFSLLASTQQQIKQPTTKTINLSNDILIMCRGSNRY